MSEENRLGCPPDCIYAMISGGMRHCGYILIAGHSRGCDPGKGCTRYRRRSARKAPIPITIKEGKPSHPSVKRRQRHATWDVVRGRELWQQGMTSAAIARELGISRPSVKRRREKYWNKGLD